MEKMEELKNLLTANVNKVTELLHKKEKEEIMEEKKKSKAGLIFAIIGIVVVVAAAALVVTGDTGLVEMEFICFKFSLLLWYYPITFL